MEREYDAAEAPLLKIINSKAATGREKNAAAQGLLGVYQKKGRGTDQLHAAFVYNQIENMDMRAENLTEGGGYKDEIPYIGFTYWPLGGWLFDLPYLLDVQLTDDELLNYIDRYAKVSRQINIETLRRKRTAYEMTKYALAVRYARQEKYQKAFEIYEQLGARPRAKRMKELIKLYDDATNTAFPVEKHLEAQYAYASFLEGHSTQVFFNDMLWRGFQTWSFLKDERDIHSYGYYPRADQGFTREERESFQEKERKLRDEQEEKWRAYKILSGVMEQAGKSELGRLAARKAIRCLDLIQTGRFGRESEIDVAKRKLIRWIKNTGPAKK